MQSPHKVYLTEGFDNWSRAVKVRGGQMRACITGARNVRLLDFPCSVDTIATVFHSHGHISSGLLV